MDPASKYHNPVPLKAFLPKALDCAAQARRLCHQKNIHLPANWTRTPRRKPETGK
jgi:hypothetical protein